MRYLIVMMSFLAISGFLLFGGHTNKAHAQEEQTQVQQTNFNLSTDLHPEGITVLNTKTLPNDMGVAFVVSFDNGGVMDCVEATTGTFCK